MQTWALVSHETQSVVEWYPTRDEAADALAEILEDEPQWETVLDVWEYHVGPGSIELAD